MTTDPATSATAPTPPGGTEPTPTIRWLQSLPRSDRRETVAELVVSEVKQSLLMDEQDELPLEVSYFDLGLTSLRLTEIRQRLEAMLGRGLDANLLFNNPTLARLLQHLAEDVLTDLLPDSAARAGGAVGA